MAERGMLHICHLDSFAAYLQGLGYEKQPLSRSLYEVLRMKKGKDTVLVFRRNAAKEHLSVILDGRKVQTRRLVKPKPAFRDGESGHPERCDDGTFTFRILQYKNIYDGVFVPPCDPGDIRLRFRRRRCWHAGSFRRQEAVWKPYWNVWAAVFECRRK